MHSSQEMQLALGEPIYMEGFADNLPRLAYPVKLKELNKLNSLLSILDCENLYENFKNDDKFACLVELITMVFRFEYDTPEELKEELENSINDVVFPKIIKNIKELCGIEEVQGDKDQGGVNQRSTTSWINNVCAVSLYTSTPIDMVKEMTYQQFKHTLSMINKKNTWEYKLATISMVKDADNYISESDNPLYDETIKNGVGMVTMKEIMNFKGGI